MKKKISRKNRSGAGGGGSQTSVRADDDLSIALAEIISSTSREKVETLRDTLTAIQKQFDSRSVTMTTTNIPDAIEKLAAVLVETSEATAKVFRLIERQHVLLGEGERLLSEFERGMQREGLGLHGVTAVVGEFRALHEGIKATAHEVVLTQEFQDLTGQKIRKVSKVVEDLDVVLRALLLQFKQEVPSHIPVGQSTQDEDIDQATTDALLKELGV